MRSVEKRILIIGRGAAVADGGEGRGLLMNERKKIGTKPPMNQSLQRVLAQGGVILMLMKSVLLQIMRLTP